MAARFMELSSAQFSSKLVAFMESVESANWHIGFGIEWDFQQRETLTVQD